MSQFRCCPHCGACLDPGERCDCWRGNILGKKKGHLYIQVGYDQLAESSGVAQHYIGIIKKLLPGIDDFTESPRKADQVYSTFRIRIW